jgi:hypothetical protein
LFYFFIVIHLPRFIALAECYILYFGFCGYCLLMFNASLFKSCIANSAISNTKIDVKNTTGPSEYNTFPIAIMVTITNREYNTDKSMNAKFLTDYYPHYIPDEM